MLDLKDAISIVEIATLTLVVLLLGNYLGHKTGRMRLTLAVGAVWLVIVIAFAIYAAVVLTLLK